MKPNIVARGGIGVLLVSLLSITPVASRASITVNFYSGTNNLPQTVADNILNNATNLSSGYERINNTSHTNFGGTSTVTFARYQDGGGACYYWFRSTNTFGDLNFLDSWEYVYWEGFGDGTLVDGAENGTDNFILMRDGSLDIAVLQFGFDTNNTTATLIASAVDLGGITFTDGVSAIQAIPEPSTAALLGAAATLSLIMARRKKQRIHGTADTRR